MAESNGSRNISFTSVELKSLSRTPQGGKAAFKASMPSDKIMLGLGWTDVPECMKGTSLEGELDAPQIELVPNDAAMARHATTIETSRIHQFATVRRELEGKRGKGYRTELHFVVNFSDMKGAQKLEAYMLTCGKSKLKASYTPQPVQEDIPGTEVQPDDAHQEFEESVQ